MQNYFVLKRIPIMRELTLTMFGALLGVGYALPAQAGYGFIELADGWRCEGQFQGKTGQGICVRRDEVNPGSPYKYYRGEVRNGTFQGRGVLVYENDDRYEGQIRNGRPNGKGTFISVKDNRRYEGDFRNGEFHGQGTYTFGQGDRYVGQFAGSQPHGYGTYSIYQNGQLSYTYTGQSYLGVINGNGVVTSAAGLRCSGVFYSNNLVGKGTCTFPKGSAFKTYTGELKNGLPDGKGTVTYTNGKQYTGQFRNGAPGLSQDGGS